MIGRLYTLGEVTYRALTAVPGPWGPAGTVHCYACEACGKLSCYPGGDGDPVLARLLGEHFVVRGDECYCTECGEVYRPHELGAGPRNVLLERMLWWREWWRTVPPNQLVHVERRFARTGGRTFELVEVGSAEPLVATGERVVRPFRGLRRVREEAAA